MRKCFLLLFVVIVVFSFTPRTGWSTPYDGPSASISESIFYYDGTNQMFGTVAENSVVVEFYAANGDFLVDFGILDPAYLMLDPVNFSGGFNNGTGGGFSIYDNMGLILSGTFDPVPGSTLTSDPFTGGEFQANLIIGFVNYNRIGTNFIPPGLFSAALGDIGALDLNTSFTTGPAATAEIQSSVPEPGTLLLLGLGLLGLGAMGRNRIKNRE